MKKYIYLTILISLGFFLPLSDYVELNHLMIVEKIGLECKNNEYQLYLKEIIPKKGNNGIDYDYKIIEATGTTITKAYQKIEKKTKKDIFLEDTRTVITNCKKKESLLSKFPIHPKKIIETTKSIKKELGKS